MRQAMVYSVPGEYNSNSAESASTRTSHMIRRMKAFFPVGAMFVDSVVHIMVEVYVIGVYYSHHD